MPHSIILMREKMDELRGNATTGSITELRTKCDTLDAGIDSMTHQSHKNQAHALLQTIQGWLESGGEFENGVAAQVDAFCESLNDLIALIP